MLTRWFDFDRSFDIMDMFRSRMDQIFEELETGRRALGVPTIAWPRLNLYDEGEALVVQAEIPGVAREDIKISGSQEGLSITGERKVSVPDGYSVHRQERGSVRFSRNVVFPVKVDADHATAELKNGILTIRLPKAPEVKPRTIDVTVA